MNYRQPTNSIGLAFVMIWCLVYTGYPYTLKTDQRSAFTQDQWNQLADTNGCQLRVSRIETQSSLRSGEKCYDPLRQIYKNIRFTHPAVSPHYLLKVAVKVVKITMSDRGFVPSGFLSGIIPQLPVLNSDLPQQKEQM